jgi:hypothetical protein
MARARAVAKGIGTATALGAILFGSLLGVSCGEDAPPSGTGGTADVTYQNSECGTCALAACSAGVTDCNADPGCAAYLQCLEGCPVTEEGDAETACDDLCPVADSSVSRDLVARLRYCRAEGVGATQCTACGKIQETNPCLNQDCAPSVETDACAICEDEACCEMYADYVANPEAIALKECLEACPDDACWLGCYDMHPDGVAAWGARFACYTIFCLEECTTGTPSACAVCSFSECASPHINCGKNASCHLLSECEAICENMGGTTPDCIAQCGEQYPDGVEDFAAFGACTTEKCASECATL